ncbi:MAG: hypothetical protein H6581_01995 [Bacteroidia bacterium]|nr:hypothetical protein [Bacteroidia bacterium]
MHDDFVEVWLIPFRAETGQIEDTCFVVGAQSFGYSRAFYRNVGEARENDVPGTDTIFDDLSKLFPGPGKKKDEDTEEDLTDGGDNNGTPAV